MRKGFGLALVLAIATAPAGAFAWRTWLGYEVYPVSEQVWEVLNEPGAGPRQYWCATGEWARRVLNVPVVTRIYIHRGLGPSDIAPGRSGVQFSLEPPPGADTSTSYSLSIRRPGENISAAQALDYCYGLKRWILN